jgi:hypothetical protein
VRSAAASWSAASGAAAVSAVTKVVRVRAQTAVKVGMALRAGVPSGQEGGLGAAASRRDCSKVRTRQDSASAAEDQKAVEAVFFGVGDERGGEGFGGGQAELAREVGAGLGGGGGAGVGGEFAGGAVEADVGGVEAGAAELLDEGVGLARDAPEDIGAQEGGGGEQEQARGGVLEEAGGHQ